MHVFAFESYGVKIRVESNRKRIIERVRRIAHVSLVGNVTAIDPESAQHIIALDRKGEQLSFVLNGEPISDTAHSKAFYNYFESRLRVLVAEYAKDLVFLHAGVIGWNGRAVIFPADSFRGKTTLVADLVKRGAVYYSDDYAILDESGLVHPFPRRLALRDPLNENRRSNVTATRLGVVGEVPLPVSAVVLTRYKPNAAWKPKLLSSGNGIIQMIPQAISIRASTEQTLKVLKTVVNRAIIAKSLRGDVKLCGKDILNFVNKLQS